MGLAEPKRRSKIAHDPRNLAWSQNAASSSFGQRIMVKQGWSEGQSLGNRSSTHLGVSDVDRLAAARVGILFKDNNLGLGAKKKKDDIEAQRTGLDAFQAMLGRLNGKSEAEVEALEKKVEDRKLEMYFQGRWGGMVFVKGGTLVGEKTFGTGEEGELGSETQKSADVPPNTENVPENEDGSKSERKEEKKRRKEEKRARKEAKALKKAAKKARRTAEKTQSSSSSTDEEDEGQDQKDLSIVSSHKSPLVPAPDEPVSSASSGSEDANPSKLKRKRSTLDLETPKATATTVAPTRNGRHLLRGRNIKAKRMAFSDMKGLDEIFMRPG